MKTMRTDLSAEGRLDVLGRVMSYRGGNVVSIPLITNFLTKFSATLERLFSSGTNRVYLSFRSVLLTYITQDRRKIEHEAFSGNLLGIIATNALELGAVLLCIQLCTNAHEFGAGVDIGILDAVIILGFPMGGIASLVSWSIFSLPQGTDLSWR
jgi:DEAD/DEAH box helicase domain-containing protein